MRTYFAEYLRTEKEAQCVVFCETLPFPDLWEDSDAEFRPLPEGGVLQRDFFAVPSSKPHEFHAWFAPQLDDAFQNLLRWVMPRPLLQRNALLLHAGGVVRDDQGYVFFGQSGAGKSTTVDAIRKLDPRAIALGDDAILLALNQNHEAVLHSAPMGCGYSPFAPPRHEAKVAGLFALEQSPVNEVLPLDPANQVARIFASAFWSPFSDQIDERLDLMTRITRTHSPIQLLRLTPTTIFWENLLNEKRKTEAKVSETPHSHRKPDGRGRDL